MLGEKEELKVNLNDYLPLRDVVFNYLREAIFSGDLKPGERLMENQLADRIGVSRTPVREAIRKLELEGLVEMVPRKGAMVATMSKKDIQNVLEVRAALEELAVKLACRSITPEFLKKLKEVNKKFTEAVDKQDIKKLVQYDVEFHDIIFTIADNDKLTQIINNLRQHIYRYRVFYLKDTVYLKTIKQEHDDIVSALESSNEALAGELIVKHISNQEKAVLKSIEEIK